MQREVSNMLKYLADSQTEMAKILEAERHTAVRMSQIVHDIPPHQPGFEGVEVLTDHSLGLAKNIGAYLNSLADLEEALADNLSYVFKVVQIPDEEE